jgi:sugar phosphate isomerase/epimerase
MATPRNAADTAAEKKTAAKAKGAVAAKGAAADDDRDEAEAPAEQASSLPRLPRVTGVCSWSLQPKGIDDLIAKVRACGVSAVQLAMEPIRGRQVGWGTPEEVFGKLAEAKIRVVSGMFEPIGEDYSTLESIAYTGGLRQTKNWEANLKRAREVAKIASDAGLSLVTFHAGFLPEDPRDRLHKTMIERIEKVAQEFSSRDVLLGLETGQERAETLLETLDGIDEPLLGINFDPANMILYGMGNPNEALEELADYVLQVHIKDATASSTPGQWGAEVPAGKGETDWPRLFKFVNATLPEVNLVIEREAGDARVADVVTARKLVEKHTK